jgi:hypothetical protein
VLALVEPLLVLISMTLSLLSTTEETTRAAAAASALEEVQGGEERLEAAELREVAGDWEAEFKEVETEEFSGVGGALRRWINVRAEAPAAVSVSEKETFEGADLVGEASMAALIGTSTVAERSGVRLCFRCGR